MSTTTQGKSTDRSTGNLKNDPDHLLVLVHGILARYILFRLNNLKSCLDISNACGRIVKEIGLIVNTFILGILKFDWKWNLALIFPIIHFIDLYYHIVDLYRRLCWREF